jgi:hypothetical protein
MPEAAELLRQILENGDVVGRDRAGRNVIRLALDDAEMDQLMAFGADDAEAEDGGDEEPYEVPLVPAPAGSKLPRFSRRAQAGPASSSSCRLSSTARGQLSL